MLASIGEPRSRQALATPAVILDLDDFERKSQKPWRGFGKQAGLSLRPHAKTHKSVEIAKRQIAAGAHRNLGCDTARGGRHGRSGSARSSLTTPVVRRCKIDSCAISSARARDSCRSRQPGKRRRARGGSREERQEARRAGGTFDIA